jgi:hypothetical protein
VQEGDVSQIDDPVLRALVARTNSLSYLATDLFPDVPRKSRPSPKRVHFTEVERRQLLAAAEKLTPAARKRFLRNLGIKE